MSQKIIFLDIDGVLNSLRYDNAKDNTQGNIDETRLLLLKEIVDKTSAKIVLSSSWRKHWNQNAELCDEIGKNLTAVFSKHSLFIYDKTPQSPTNDRAEEIQIWLNTHKNIEAFVILDDIAFGWGTLKDHLVQTNYRIGKGLEEKHIQKAIDILTQKNEHRHK